MAQSLTKSSASLVAAGGDLAEAASLTAVANKIIQDADSVGTALKTTSLRLRGTDVSVLEEEGLDSEGAVTSKSKLQSKVKALSGVDILTATGEYKSTYEILSQIADVWEDINDLDQAALLELISGKRNSSVIAAILQNPEELKRAFEDANDASGSALKENEKYLDSIQGKIDQFNNSVQSLWSNLLNADLIKGIVEWATKIVKSLDTTKGKVLAIVKAVALLMAYKKINPLDWITNLSKNIQADGVLGTLKNLGASLLGIQTATRAVTAETIANTIATETNNVADQQAILEKMGLAGATGTLNAATKETIANNIAKLVTDKAMTVQMGQQAAAMLGYTLSVDAAGKATVALDATTKSFMASNPIGWILGIVSVVITLVTVLSSLVDTTEKVAEATKEAMNAYATANSTLRDHKKTIEEIKGDYQKLADGVDDLGNNVSLTTEEYERYNEITNQIADMFPHLIAGYTEEGNAIIKMKGNVEALTEAYEKEARAARDAVLAESKSVVKDSHNTIKDNFWSDSDGFWGGIGKGLGEAFSFGFWQADASTTSLHTLGKYVNGDSSAFDYENSEYGISKVDNISRVLQTLKDAGADVGYWEIWAGDEKALQRVIDEQRDIVQSVLNTVDQEIQTAAANNRNIIDAYLGNNDEYEGLDDKSKALISQVVQNLDDEFLTSFKSNTELFGWVQNNLVGQFRDLDSNAQSQINLGFGLMTKFNNGEVTIEEYEAQIQSIIGLIDALNLENEDEILKSFRIAFNIDEDGKVDAAKQNVVKNILQDEFDANVINLTKSDLDIVDKNLSSWEIPDGTLLSWDELTEKIDTAKSMAWSASKDFESVSESIDGIQDAYSTLNDVVTEYNTNGFLTLDSLQSLLSLEPEYLAALQMENGQLTINQDVLKNMVQARLAEAKATVIQSAMDQLHALSARTAADAVNDNALAASNATEPLGTYASALGTVAQDAIVAAGAVTALNAAIAGAEKNEFVDQSEIDAIISTMNNSLNMIDELGAGLTTNFNGIMGTDGGTGKGDGEDAINDAFQREMDYWENRIVANQAKYEQLQNEIDLLEAKGQKADASFYEEQIYLENERLWLLGEQKKAAEAHLKTLKEGSEEWWEVADILNGLESDIDDVTASIVDLQDAIGELDTYRFEEFSTRLDNIVDKLGTIRDLIAPDGEEDWFDEEGNWTEEGIAVLGTYLNELETFKQGYANTMAELGKYSRAYAGNEDYYASLGIHSEQEYYDMVEKLTDQQYDYAKSISDTEQSVIDMYESNIDKVEEYTESLIDSYNDYIDSVKEALDAERDLYDFKKNVQKQAKDIAAIERRIASLSGSTNAADIAERRKLEAQLYESRESLNDTYYDHAKESQQNALDSEAKAYEESMNRFVEGLRTSLEEATTNMDAFLASVTIAASMNADAILEKYEGTGLLLDPAITNPWVHAAEKVGEYGGDATALMDAWKKEGYFSDFSTNAGANLQSPWTSGADAVADFGASVATEMSRVVSNVQSNVKKAKDSLASLTDVIKTTDIKPDESGEPDKPNNPDGGGGAQKKYYVTKTLSINGTKLSVTKSDADKSKATEAATIAITKEYERYQKERGQTQDQYASLWLKNYKNKVKTSTAYYAKGTAGVSKDQLAIVDELGPELILHADPTTGRLQYLTKGSGVVPSDMTTNLMEWGQFTPDSLNLGSGVNVNMINNAVNKPEFNFAFDALVKAENITEETLPAVKKLVTQELNRFTKELNYALKGKGAR